MRKVGKKAIEIIVLNKGVNGKQANLWNFSSRSAKEEKKPSYQHLVRNMPFRIKIFK